MELYQSVFKEAYNKAQAKVKNTLKNEKIKIKFIWAERSYDWNGNLSLNHIEKELEYIKELRRVWKTQGERATKFYKQHRNKQDQKAHRVWIKMPKTKGQNGKDVIL